MYLDISWGLLSLLKGIGERALPFFFPPKLIISSSAYGHLKDRGVDRDHYAILVGLKFVNASQKPVLVTNVQATFEDEPLETIQTSLSRPGILTTKGWRILDAEREQRLLTVPGPSRRRSRAICLLSNARHHRTLWASGTGSTEGSICMAIGKLH